MEREAVLVGIDVGTSKVCALIGEVARDGRLTIMGHGTVPASGLKKGVVINIDQTVRSIADAVEKAERQGRPTLVYLAVEGDRCGTFRDEPTPSAVDVQNVGERAA